METGILSDGSLSSRKKGDLFWKKFKLQEQAEQAFNGFNKDEVILKGIILAYKAMSDFIDVSLDGNEFRDYPPTATGNDIKREAIARAMKARDRMLNDTDIDSDKLEALKAAVTTFFLTIGFDEGKNKLLEGNGIPNVTNAFNANRLAYEKFFPFKEGYVGTYQPQDLPQKEYKVTRLRPSVFGDYSEDIPENYIGQLKNGSVTAEEYSDPSDGETVAVVISAVHGGFVELIWVSIRPKIREDGDAIRDLFRFIIKQAYDKRVYKGVFIEIHKDEHTSRMSSILNSAGMRVYFEKNNIYECTLSEVADRGMLSAAAEKMPCKPISELSRAEMDEIEERILKCKQPVPVGYPIMWESFRQDLSMAYLGKKPRDAGLFLVSEIGDSLDIELMYGSDPIIVAALAGNAFVRGNLLLSSKQKLLIPIVNDYTRPLIKKLIPTAVRGDIAEAVIWF